MNHLTSLRALILASLLTLPCSQAQAVSKTYKFLKASVSLPVLTEGVDPKDGTPITITDRLLTKQVINLARGRALDAAVPKNELLCIGLLTDFSTADPIYLVVVDADKIDKSSKPFFGQPGVILTVIGEMPTFKAVRGKPKGSSVIGFSTVSTRAVGDATNGILANTLNASAKVRGTSMSATGVLGDFSFTKAATQIDGIVAGGTFRSSGANLFLMNIDFPPGL